ncbi:MAG: T9SS type A sorting domain-containing protein [Candidatus Aegiribacteria sp.]|nr:T9SS type A sorting domain-containing protein [Candidatus Aegiribacteria sp.]
MNIWYLTGGGLMVAIDECEQEEIPPETLVLLSSNPSQGSIRFGVNTPHASRISLLDLSGRIVEEYVTGEEGEDVFRTGELEPGIYFLRAETENIETKRIVVIK